MRIPALLLLLVAAVGADGQDAITGVRWIPATHIEQAALDDLAGGRIHPLPLPFTPYNTVRPKTPLRREVIADRNEYLADDPVGQFVAVLLGENVTVANAALRIDVLEGEAGDKAAATKTLSPVEQPKAAFFVDMQRLPPGKYRVRATLLNVPGARRIQACAFSKSGESRKAMPFPEEGVPLVVHAQAHVPDAAWPITTAVPLPRGVVDKRKSFMLLENGQRVPAQFAPRATWYPDRMVKWMGLDFVAKYDGGKPRQYRLVQQVDGAGQELMNVVNVTETPDAFVVNTGAIQFKVGRRAFAGVEEACLVNKDRTVGKPVIAGAGGPFLMDERRVKYSAVSDEGVKVVVEESGPVRATIYASGWYASNDNGERCCIFQTRISAYAGQPWINVNHRTIITYDTDRKKLRELGFAVKTPGAAQWAFGGDGQAKAGAFAPPGKDRAGKPVPPPSVWLHQDRWDRFRLVQAADQAPTEGRKSDGWAALSTPDATVSVAFRNIWQLYPKELELAADEMNVHVWPRHGRVAFTEEEELGSGTIYKLFYAHQGEHLDLKFPQKYFDAIRKKMVALEQQDINALTGNGLGLATTNDFCFYLDAPGADPAKTAAWAKLYQQNPHAITDPVYNGLTEVEGRFAGKSDKFPDQQRILTDAYHGYTMSVDYLDDYGMWIWPDVHNNWSPISKQAQWHRWWHLSHYQNVWEGLFLYFRSGEPWLCDWGRNNTQHYMDVGTVNYDDPKNPVLCRLTGANYHTKGFTPWGSPRQGERCGDDYCEVGAHFVNPDAHLFRYLLLGDRHGLALAKGWAQAFSRVALPPERSRECNTALGEMISYYENTWDPQAILYIRDMANDHNSRPWKEIPAFPGHPMFHDRWVMRYWALTRDPMMKQRIMEWFAPETAVDRGKYSYPQLRALVWQWTGTKEYLTDYLPNLSSMWEPIYLNPDDPLNYYGGRAHFFPTHSQAQMLPYYLQALLDAGIQVAPPPEYTGAPVTKVASLKKDTPQALQVEKSSYWARKVGYLMPVGAEPTVTIEFTAPVSMADGMLPSGASVSYVRVEDADGNALMATAFVGGSKRPTAAVTLDGRKNKAPWKVYKNANDPTFKWTGAAEALFIGPTPEEVKAAAEGKK